MFIVCWRDNEGKNDWKIIKNEKEMNMFVHQLGNTLEQNANDNTIFPMVFPIEPITA